MKEFKNVYIMELPNTQNESALELWKKEIIRFKEYLEETFNTPGTEESKEPPKKQPLKEVLQDKADEKRAQKNAPAQTKHKQQDMEL